jgi:hypothetical protein
VNAEQASKRDDAEADLPGLQGRPPSLGEIATAPNDSAGVVAPACVEEKIVGTREAPAVRGRGSQPELREEQAGLSGMREICKSGSMSGKWKGSMVWLVRHRQTKEPVTDRLNLNHGATS